MNIYHIDLFSGVGGFALAASWAGWETIAFCEIEPYCRQVLAKHWPGVPICHDIRELTIEYLRGLGIGPIGLITGGFPCQGISSAGKGQGLEDSRSGLWFEMHRVISECLPVWVVIENSPLLRIRGADIVLEGLEALGYACWSHVVGSDDAGAPHRRKRTVIVARRWRGDGEGPDMVHPYCGGCREAGFDRVGYPLEGGRDAADMPSAIKDTSAGMGDPAGADRRQDNPCRCGCDRELGLSSGREQGASRSGAGSEVANSDGERREECDPAALTSESRFACERPDCGEAELADAFGERRGEEGELRHEPAAQRTAAGSPLRVADTKSLALGSGFREGQQGGVGRRRSGDGHGAGGSRSDGVTQSGMGGTAARFSYELDGDHIGRWPAGRGEPQHEWEAPRLAEKVKNREARLRGIGNAVNPQMFYPILRIIRDMEEEIWQTQ